MDELKIRIAEILQEKFTQTELDKMYNNFSLDDWLEILELTANE